MAVKKVDKAIKITSLPLSVVTISYTQLNYFALLNMAIGHSQRIATNVGRVARVLRSKPNENAMDIIYLDDGSEAYSVKVLAEITGSNHGIHYLPDPRPQSELGRPDDVNLGLGGQGDRDMIVVVITLMGSLPLIIGCLPPEMTHNAFNYGDFPDMRLDRHVSDFETITLSNGSTTLRHPSGTKIEIGEVPTLSGKNVDKNYSHTRNKKSILPITLSVPTTDSGSSTVVMDKNGDIAITAINSATIKINDNIAIKIDKSGNMSLKAANIAIKSSGILSLAGSAVSIKADAALTVTSGTIAITGSGAVSVTSSGAVNIHGKPTNVN